MLSSLKSLFPLLSGKVRMLATSQIVSQRGTIYILLCSLPHPGLVCLNTNFRSTWVFIKPSDLPFQSGHLFLPVCRKVALLPTHVLVVNLKRSLPPGFHPLLRQMLTTEDSDQLCAQRGSPHTRTPPFWSGSWHPMRLPWEKTIESLASFKV